MKKALLLLLIVAGYSAGAQSLKDMLYSGKLKLDSNTVIRKGDDLSSEIDTATKRPVVADNTKPVIVATTPTKTPTTEAVPNVVATDRVIAEPVVTTPVKETAAPVKSNNKLWKEYADSLSGVLKSEVLTSKKVKKETYYVTVEYEIATDAQVNILNVTTSPENEFLQEQVKTRVSLTPPQLTPSTDSAGKTRKVKRNYTFSITKE